MTRVAAKPVRLEELSKRFGQVHAVHPLDLAVERGELLVLVGPSGCGKSTVLRMIAGVEEPTAGRVWIGERLVNDLEPAERDVAMVFQSYALYPHMTVRRNLAFGLRMRGVPRAEISREVERTASLLGLSDLLDRRPGQLSGGQRQRVALGRAIVREPAVFLFDEPLSNLDARLRQEMRTEIADLHQRLGATMIFVTHDQVEAMSLGRRIAVMNEGSLQQVASPMEVYRRPANLFVARFIGTPAINVVDGELREAREAGEPGTDDRSGEARPSAGSQQHGGGGRAPPGELVPGGPGPEASGPGYPAVFQAPGLRLTARRLRPVVGPAVLGVRPEALGLLSPDAEGSAFRSAVRRLEPLGSELLVHVEGPAGSLWVARVEPNAGLREGDHVGVAISIAGAHLFAGVGGERVGTAGSQ